MSLGEFLFGKKGSVPRLDLAALQAGLTAGVLRFLGRPIEIDLVRARFADRCRDVHEVPLLPEEFEALVEDLDEESCRRLAVLTGVLDLEEVRQTLAMVIAGGRLLRDVAGTAFICLARETPLLTLDLLRESPLRIEELARRFVVGLGAAVRGESARVSQQRLERLDYGRLLAEAEKAKEAAAERMEKLRQLQEEHEQSRPRRGKW